MSRSISRAVIASLSALVAFCINAAPITHEFSVTATGGPLNGATALGTFSYDSTSIVPGASNEAIGLLTDLDFTWNGIHYDETDANTGVLTFRPDGSLSGVVFGNNCFVGACAVLAGSEQWFVNFPFRFSYSVEGAMDIFDGIVRLSVPEPGSLALVCLAFVIAVYRCGHRRSTSAAVLAVRSTFAHARSAVSYS